ncbi:MAG TPA: hypothetical protein DCX06_03430 [Opitutae bacterium]|nr:hypothetical protein [Opitutae bacterium]
MLKPESRLREGQGGPTCTNSSCLHWLIIGFAILIVLGGGTHPLSLALLLLALGFAMGIRSLDWRIERLSCLWLIAFISWILITLWLPAAESEWRLKADHLGIPIRSAVVSQLWVTFEALIPFLAGFALLTLTLSYKPNFGQRRQGIHWLASVLCLLSVAAIVAEGFDWRLPWADRVHVFSWFPNRNQTALVFACGSVLSFGLAFLPWHRRRLDREQLKKSRELSILKVGKASLWAFGSGGLLLYAVFQSLSRGALIAWLCGMLTLLLLASTRTNRTTKYLLRFVPVAILLLFSFFVFFGGQSRDRIMDFAALPLNEVDGNTGNSAEFRLQIYADTLSMIADQPWTGIGLGQFQYIFPHYRSASLNSAAIRHPESDWLWWAAELGVVGLSIILVGLGGLLFRLRGPKEYQSEGCHTYEVAVDQLYRHCALAALVPFFVHSVVDVGAHRLGTVCLAIILYTLALPALKASLPCKTLPLFWRGCGVVFSLTGAGLISLSVLRSPMLSTYSPLAEEPLQNVPLQWQPYFRFAVKTYSGNPQVGLDAFERARFIGADNSQIAFQEGSFLLQMNNFVGAFAAFDSAILSSYDSVDTFQQVLSKTVSKRVFHIRLRAMAGKNPVLIATYWSAISPRALETEEVITLLKEDWSVLTASAQQIVLKRLAHRKRTDQVLSLFESSLAEKQKVTWPIVMQALIAEDRWEAALALFDQHFFHKPLPPEPWPDDVLKQLQTAALIHSKDALVATQLIRAYLSRNMWDEVRRTAERTRNLADSPPETLYWLGRALAETDHRQEAAYIYAEWLSLQGE